MILHVFARKGRPGGHFDRLQRSKKHELVAHGLDEFRRYRPENVSEEFCFLDLEGLNKQDVQSTLRSLLRKRSSFMCAVVDPRGRVDDPGWLFHRGVCDYVGPAVARSGITVRRLDQVVSYAGWRFWSPEPGEELLELETASLGQWLRLRSQPVDGLKPATSWDSVVSAGEYTFWMLFAQMDGAERHRIAASEQQARTLFEGFHGVIQRETAAHEGKPWIWKETGGLVLFPFDHEQFGAVLSGIRLMLNRVIVNVEDLRWRSRLSYRLALHVGNTTYRSQGSTGTIISDAVNYVFHLGERFTRPGCFTITDAAVRSMPEGLAPYFVHEGEFEGRDIFRFRNPVGSF